MAHRLITQLVQIVETRQLKKQDVLRVARVGRALFSRWNRPHACSPRLHELEAVLDALGLELRICSKATPKQEID